MNTDEAKVKNAIRGYLGENIEEMLSDINTLPPKERCAARMRLLDYVMPKQQAVKTTETRTQSTVDFLLNQEAGLE